MPGPMPIVYVAVYFLTVVYILAVCASFDVVTPEELKLAGNY